MNQLIAQRIRLQDSLNLGLQIALAGGSRQRGDQRLKQNGYASLSSQFTVLRLT
jgi:hypothetical protein